MGGMDSDDPFIFRLNDNGSGPSLLVKVCAERGWRMYHGFSSGEDKWNLWWRTSAFPAGFYKNLGDFQFMNHIPKGGSICRKDSLSRLLRCMRKVYGSIYDFRQQTREALHLHYANRRYYNRQKNYLRSTCKDRRVPTRSDSSFQIFFKENNKLLVNKMLSDNVNIVAICNIHIKL